jgi:hypothetical protein
MTEEFIREFSRAGREEHEEREKADSTNGHHAEPLMVEPTAEAE